MSSKLAILIAQINPTVGAIENNTQHIIEIIQTHQQQCDVIVFPELAVTGYPPEDLLLRDELYDRVEKALQRIQHITQQCHVIVGHPRRVGHQRFNSASLLYQNQCLAIYDKQHLPNDGVFDEQRYFTPGQTQACTFLINQTRCAICICEDIWHPGPVEQVLAESATLLFCINASPFEHQKYQLRQQRLTHYTQQGLAIVYVNQVGGQDELIFDGQSVVMNAYETQPAFRCAPFQEQHQRVEWHGHFSTSDDRPLQPEPAAIALFYQALVYSLQEYTRKNHFSRVILGLSGGIDSALTLAIAVDALGAEKVHVFMLPSCYTSAMSLEDAKAQAQHLNVAYDEITIDPLFQQTLDLLAPHFHGKATDITEENMQARLRGLLLMAVSNKSGAMLLNTSNKSETAVGYSTLYGDMCGGFALLIDVLKTEVYQLAHYRNQMSPVIPNRVLTRLPSAELAANQCDQDSLPPYDVLDDIIKGYMQFNWSLEQLVQHGHAPDIVAKIIRLIQRNEYKRRQAAIGPKVSARAFGRDWRYPISAGF